MKGYTEEHAFVLFGRVLKRIVGINHPHTVKLSASPIKN